MLLPMEGIIKVINSILIPYVMYALPLMKLSTTNWKEILSPIKSFLWKTTVGEKRHMHWGKWEDASRPKEWGGLGIINPITQCQAICAKFVTKMVIRIQSWVSMLKAMVQDKGIFSKGGKWIDMDWSDFLLAPSWLFTQAKGYSMA